MVNKYLATRRDLKVIEEALGYVWHPKMRFVFHDRIKVATTIVVSYDSKFIYLWTPQSLKNLEELESSLKNYHLYKIPHRLKLKGEWQYAWFAELWIKAIEKLLPESIRKAARFQMPMVSGGLLTPFIELQKQKGLKLNPYVTKESYLATILHEFGHVYWNQHKLWWFSNKKENLQYLSLAKKLYEEKDISSQLPLKLPFNSAVGEIFAFCTEYYSASVFWPEHKKALDNFAKNLINHLIKEEGGKNLEKEDSVVEPYKNPHHFAFIFGKILMTHNPNNWPQLLITPPKLTA